MFCTFRHAPHLAVATIHRNRVKPAREIIRLAKRAQVLIGFAKDLLSNVFGIGVIAKVLAGESVNGSFVPINQNTESGIVPRKESRTVLLLIHTLYHNKTPMKWQSSHEISSGEARA